MEMLVPLALLACPVGMGVIMWLMMRNKQSGDATGNDKASGTDQEIASLRAEVDALREQSRRERQL